MTLVELLEATTRLGIVLVPDGDGLVVEARAGVVTPRLKETLTARKRELLGVLTRLAGMRVNTWPVPCAKSVSESPGGPGHCFSCGDSLGHPEAYGRCVTCWLALDLFYRDRSEATRQRRTG